MTELLLGYTLGNTLLAVPLAILAWMIGRSRRYPSLAHFAWVVVMVRLVMPPIAAMPWLSVSIPLLHPSAAMKGNVHEQGARVAPSDQTGPACATASSPELADAPHQQDRALPLPEGSLPAA